MVSDVSYSTFRVLGLLAPDTIASSLLQPPYRDIPNSSVEARIVISSKTRACTPPTECHYQRCSQPVFDSVLPGGPTLEQPYSVPPMNCSWKPEVQNDNGSLYHWKRPQQSVTRHPNPSIRAPVGECQYVVSHCNETRMAFPLVS